MKDYSRDPEMKDVGEDQSSTSDVTLETIDAIEQYPQEKWEDQIKIFEGMDTTKTEIGLQGRAGEMVTILSRDRMDLNRLDLRMKGGNFPVYDNVGEQSVGSVKVRGVNSDIAPTKQEVSAYLSDFRTAIGQGVDQHKFDKAAGLMLEAKDRGLIRTPTAMQDVATLEDMKSYLRKQGGELFIPDNHVSAVRDSLRSSLENSPELYGGSPTGFSRQETDSLTGRVRPLGSNTLEIRRLIQEYKDARRQNRK